MDRKLEPRQAAFFVFLLKLIIVLVKVFAPQKSLVQHVGQRRLVRLFCFF